MKTAIIRFNSGSVTQKMTDFDDLYTAKLDVQIKEESYTDNTLDELFDQVEKVKEIPKTSQPSPQNLLDTFNLLTKKYERIFILTPSPELSGTHQVTLSTLNMLKEEDKKKFYVINTKSFALSEAIICDLVIDLIDSNATTEQIISSADALSNKITTYIIPGSFDYLKMGGRVNLTKSLIGKIMNLKLLIEHKEGIAEVKCSARGYKKLFKQIENLLSEYDIDFVYSGEINAEEKYQNMLFTLLNEYSHYQTLETSIIMAAHFGPNTLGFAVVEK